MATPPVEEKRMPFIGFRLLIPGAIQSNCMLVTTKRNASWSMSTREGELVGCLSLCFNCLEDPSNRGRGNIPHFRPSRQCCIAAKCYSLGARFMDDQPIFSVDPAATGLTPVHFLRYFYYGGIAYTGVKQWKHALDSFLMVSPRCLVF